MIPRPIIFFRLASFSNRKLDGAAHIDAFLDALHHIVGAIVYVYSNFMPGHNETDYRSDEITMTELINVYKFNTVRIL